ncbi:Glyoxylase, beta-lactamase superfamily II [Paramicrobacterium humi]|uniref:Glyoxylase, beta-lactamase superfamily II n=1 Tax=Paramicrobacterium humi TaxID=640635 RepID=A0A1H4N9C3_9MICO|nr:MBL fold metallo-hydrolase [Microbacterium humi]SEB91879.1 Glyoxylase, beta-lactamase superfamily II [Microbacterium humi]
MASAPRGRQPRFIRRLAPGVHRLEHAYVNCYLLEDETGVTIVDAAFPTSWRYVRAALGEIGRSFDDVRALVLTHAHFDHLGIAHRLNAEHGIPARVHPEDHRIARHPYRYARERTPFLYPFKYPRAIPILAAMTFAGAVTVRGAEAVEALPAEGALEVPGSPEVIFTPGHTMGHCALWLPGSGTLITGDALVTLDPYKGTRGPQIIAGAATANSTLALESLDKLAATDAQLVLPGHGDPWRDGIRSAVDEARTVGAT